MSVITLEGIVEDGMIRLIGNVRLPERVKVYVIVPGVQGEPEAHIYSPRLADPSRVADFELDVLEESTDASI